MKLGTLTNFIMLISDFWSIFRNFDYQYQIHGEGNKDEKKIIKRYEDLLQIIVIYNLTKY